MRKVFRSRCERRVTKNTGRSRHNFIMFGRNVQRRKIKGEGVRLWACFVNKWLSGKTTYYIFFFWNFQIVEVFHTILVHFNFKEVEVDVEVAIDLPYFSECLMKVSWKGSDERSVGNYVNHWHSMFILCLYLNDPFK